MASHSHAQTPLSRHPLFPTVVALWFAALLGLGSLAIRASVLERVVLALHLDLVVPAAAPPLGFTARMLLALVLTCGGGLLGFVLARRLGRAGLDHRAPANRARTRRPAADAVVVPAQAAPHDGGNCDDGEDLARLSAARAEPPRRRRALTAEDDAPAAPLDLTPPPGTDPVDPLLAPRILTVGDLESIPPLDAPAAIVAAPVATPLPTAERRPAPPPALAPLPLATTAPVDGTAALRLRQAPLDSLGVVELVERFALALAARQSRPPVAVAAAEAHAPAAAPPPFAAPAPESPAPAFAPAAFAPAAFHAPEIPPPAATPYDAGLASDRADEWSGDDADLPEDEFSSLLDMKPPVRPTIALADEQTGALVQPVVLFPGQVPGNGPVRAPGAAFGTNPAQTEQALREALAALQRMSGAA